MDRQEKDPAVDAAGPQNESLVDDNASSANRHVAQAKPSDDVTALAEGMALLFAGNERNHYIYDPKRARRDGFKLEVKHCSRAVTGPADVGAWQGHLAGETALGVIPIRD